MIQRLLEKPWIAVALMYVPILFTVSRTGDCSTLEGGHWVTSALKPLWVEILSVDRPL